METVPACARVCQGCCLTEHTAGTWEKSFPLSWHRFIIPPSPYLPTLTLVYFIIVSFCSPPPHTKTTNSQRHVSVQPIHKNSMNSKPHVSTKGFLPLSSTENYDAQKDCRFPHARRQAVRGILSKSLSPYPTLVHPFPEGRWAQYIWMTAHCHISHKYPSVQCGHWAYLHTHTHTSMVMTVWLQSVLFCFGFFLKSVFLMYSQSDS